MSTKPPPRLLSPYCFIASLRSVHGLISTLRTAYRLTTTITFVISIYYIFVLLKGGPGSSPDQFVMRKSNLRESGLFHCAF